MNGNYIIEEDTKRILRKISLESLAGKVILLTGGTGLIGSYFVYSLKEYNSRNDCYVKLLLVAHKILPDWLSFLEDCSWAEIVYGDLSELDFLQKLPMVDFVIHAAGYGQPGMFLEDKLKTIRINTVATDILLSKVKKNGTFLFLSTSEIYSGSPNIPYHEDEPGRTTPQHGRACYIEGKRLGESICMAYIDKGIHAKIARVSLAYGPCFHKNDKRVLNNFIEKAVTGNISMLDSGEARRVYCYVADAVEVLWDILLRGNDTVYNVGGKGEISIKGLADVIAESLGVDVIVPTRDDGMDDAPKAVAMDVGKIMNEFQKTEFVGIEEGVKRTIKWYCAQYLSEGEAD